MMNFPLFDPHAFLFLILFALSPPILLNLSSDKGSVPDFESNAARNTHLELYSLKTFLPYL